MKQRKNAMTVVIVKNGLPKEVNVTDEIAKMLENAYQQSRVYGLGGSTTRKLKDFFGLELAEFQRLVENDQAHGKAFLFCEAFHIPSNESPLLVEALRWVEYHKDDEGFSSRTITLDTLLMEDVLGYRLPVEYNPYTLLVEDFEAWVGKRLVDAKLSVSFMRFLKFFYSLIK